MSGNLKMIRIARNSKDECRFVKHMLHPDQ